MRHFEALKDNIKQMETKHSQRERDLHQIIKNTHQVASVEMSEEVDKWKKVVDGKNRETEKFRAELDSILEVLKELQRQGVMLPYRNSTSMHHR